MRLFRYALIAGLVAIFGIAIFQTLVWFGVWGSVGDSQVKPLDDGDQEIALIEPATSGEEWGRLVTALQLLELDWPKINPSLPALSVNLDNAFPPLTADVPEVVFSQAGAPKQRLRLRWYKISGEHNAESWIAKLQARKRQPIAVMGGGTSDRAVTLAYKLKKAYGDDPNVPAPVFLITTATSEKTPKLKALINVYQKRSFRFSFTNQKMVEALLAFAQHRKYPDADKPWAESLWAGKNAAASTDAPTMHTVTWDDERYSQDMNALFEEEFNKRFPKGEFFPPWTISYSAGGFSNPTPQEQVVVNTFLALRTPVAPNSFLVLPTQTVRMRRVLIHLRQRSTPNAPRNLVVLNGDAISFHSVYRDRDATWNILDLPYSLVFFSHRNPIDHASGFTWQMDDRAMDGSIPQRTTSGTHDVLLYRDIFEAILYAAYDDGKLLGDPLAVRKRLAATCWHHPPADRPRVCNSLVHRLQPDPKPFFDADGNRQSQTGEHIVWLKPNFTDDRVDIVSKISVWARQPDANGGAWQLVEAHAVEGAP